MFWLKVNTSNKFVFNGKLHNDTLTFSETDDIKLYKDLSSIKSIKNVLNYVHSSCLFFTHLINECFRKEIFPDAWKTARVKSIPKINNPERYKDLRPISILRKSSRKQYSSNCEHIWTRKIYYQLHSPDFG